MAGPQSTRPTRNPRNDRPIPIGASAALGPLRLRSFQVGALPLLNHYFERLKLSDLLRRYLPADDVRQKVPTERVALLLVGNVLASREPLYAIPEWAARHSPDLFDLFHHEIASLSLGVLLDAIRRSGRFRRAASRAGTRGPAARERSGGGECGRISLVVVPFTTQGYA